MKKNELGMRVEEGMKEHSRQRDQLHDLQGRKVCLRPVCLKKTRVAGEMSENGFAER